MSDIVIKVENLSKQYRLGTINHGMLHKDMQSWWARIRGKEDPNLMVSSNHSIYAPSANERFWALEDISFDVKDGEVLGIIGHNGAGKSTLLKVLSRVTAPTRGTARLKGRVSSLLEVGTGFHPELTGRENVYLNGAILGMTKKEINRKFDEIVAFAEIEKFIDTPVKRYSSGMYVRLAFAVVAHLEPEILIVDEVLAVGDAGFQKKCLGKMGDVSKKGRTILFVSHNMAAVRQLCSRCLLLDKGNITADGETSTVIESYLESQANNSNKVENHYKECNEKPFQVLSMRLINKAGEVTQNFDCDNPILVEMICVSRISTPGLYGWLSISNKEGTTVLISDTFDILPNGFDSLSPNKYNVHVHIPPRTLGHGDYTVSVSFSSLRTRDFDIDTPQEGCSFHLDDLATWRGNRRQGFFSTLLKWEISKIPDSISRS